MIYESKFRLVHILCIPSEIFKTPSRQCWFFHTVMWILTVELWCYFWDCWPPTLIFSHGHMIYESKFILYSFLLVFLCIYSGIFKMPGCQCWIFHTVTCCEIYAGVGWISWLQVRVFTHFPSLFFSICSTIATQCAYDISKGWVQRLQSYINFSRKWGDRGYRYEFSLIFLHFFKKIHSTIATKCA